LVDAVRISELDPILEDELTSLDELVINDVDPNDVARENIVTKRTTISSLIDYITSQNLVFENSITVNGTIKPEDGEELDIIVNDLNVLGDLVLGPVAHVSGLYVNRHMTDVNVAYDNIETGHSLFWDDDVTDKLGFKGSWISKPGIEDAPKDGKEYVRKDGEWVEVIADEPPCDDGYYVRRCAGNGLYFWEDISDLLFPYSRITQENGGLIYTQLGEVIVTQESFKEEGPPGPQGPQGPEGPEGPEGPQGETGATGASPTEIETFSIDWEGPGNP